MDSSYLKLCDLLRSVGKLRDTRQMEVDEMVACFLNILAHDVKNREQQWHFRLLGSTISKCFNLVLNAVLRLHEVLLKNPSL
uniref:DUF8040 domain-containing protein n=1 Tax=Nelumbo nucifera TaxID=4432 RepID=A0A822Z7I5_NELNU|nr:TPA_asm: hypothetical protein HUJ06_013248 [Nelumbo nucifera]